MVYQHLPFVAHRQARWMRPDAARFLRPDAAKFIRVGSDPADVYPALMRQRDTMKQRDDRQFAEAIAQQRAVLDSLRRELVAIKSALRSFEPWLE